MMTSKEIASSNKTLMLAYNLNPHRKNPLSTIILNCLQKNPPKTNTSFKKKENTEKVAHLETEDSLIPLADITALQ